MQAQPRSTQLQHQALQAPPLTSSAPASSRDASGPSTATTTPLAAATLCPSASCTRQGRPPAAPNTCCTRVPGKMRQIGEAGLMRSACSWAIRQLPAPTHTT
eukprot:GHRQ01020235.1.p1 GENE.GHRQ01020235.1~~GHRQ01020235.1.p1  ORF type:complete len:102 (+),score=19.96 GHRQ01020235.1:466-771(+)